MNYPAKSKLFLTHCRREVQTKLQSSWSSPSDTLGVTRFPRRACLACRHPWGFLWRWWMGMVSFSQAFEQDAIGLNLLFLRHLIAKDLRYIGFHLLEEIHANVDCSWSWTLDIRLRLLDASSFRQLLLSIRSLDLLSVLWFSQFVELVASDVCFSFSFSFTYEGFYDAPL